MRSESISRAKNNLSALVKEVQAGKTILITDRGVPVAKLVPVRLGKGVPPRVLALAQQGLVSLPERPPSLEWLDLPMPRLGPGRSAVDVLLEERLDSR
jgi:prevent-host-death family protein